MKRGPKAQPTATRLPRLRAKTPAARLQEFARRHLRHTKGEWAGQPIRFADWQRRDIVAPLFDVRRPDGTRQYRTAYVEIPRKNGKSTLASALALYLLYADGEPGADIVSAAADRQQAAIVFDAARAMVEADPGLRALTLIYRRELVVPSTGSRYQVISSEAYSKHGLNLSAAIVDELHAHESRELLDVLATSMGARRQPLMFVITTAGYDRTSVCWQLHEHAVKVRDGVIRDESFLPVLYGASLEDDWTDPATWAKANPGLGTTIRRDYLEQECRRAREMPAYENAFKRLHLNIWTEAETRWLPMERWDACGAPVDPSALRGRPCFVGVDLSATRDLSALVAIFPDQAGGYDVLADFWLPAAMLPDRAKRHGVFDVWARAGVLRVTEGNVVDHDAIERRIRELGALYRVEAVGIDPWNATQMLARLQADALPAVPVQQTIGTLTAATKALEALVLQGRLRHGGHPILRWCASHVTVEVDHNENVRPSKKKSTERIDGIAALVNALTVALPATVGSVYDERPPIFVDL
ncbi:MAG TPA: terminase TerL endonuclease subunit [Methylomirabilota bacterium]|nr:terminase TerL endonuclease subunit [Methylomirabilota bacterium]